MGGSNLRQQVKLPPGEDLDEWLAYNCTSSVSLQHGNPEHDGLVAAEDGPPRYFWVDFFLLLSSCPHVFDCVSIFLRFGHESLDSTKFHPIECDHDTFNDEN